MASDLTSSRDSTPIDITGAVGDDAIRVRGRGTCTYAHKEYIRGVPSTMWQVDYRGATGGIAHANIIVWRPDGGGVDQVSFILETESESYRINTVVGEEAEGSGSVMIRPEGGGFQLVFVGENAEGALLRLAMTCADARPG